MMTIIRDHLVVGRDDRPQVIAEGDVHRWQEVECPHAHIQHVRRGLRRFAGEPVHQIGVQLRASAHFEQSWQSGVLAP